MDITKEVSTNATEPTKSKAHVNQFFHAKTLATSEFRQVVTPNVDTLYSQVFFDLKDDALVIRKPYADRYLTFQIMDAWSNTVAILGTGGDTDEEKHTYLQVLLSGEIFLTEWIESKFLHLLDGLLEEQFAMAQKIYQISTNCKMIWMPKPYQFFYLMVKCQKALMTKIETMSLSHLQ